MNPNFVGRVLRVLDPYSVVVNIGTNKGVVQGQEFLLIGLGETITDPDTGEILEQLEMVRGKVVVEHVQQKISTLVSTGIERDPETKEIKRKQPSAYSYASVFGDRESVTEVIKTGAQRKKALLDPLVGDYIMRV
jgi:hypothetical protein